MQLARLADDASAARGIDRSDDRADGLRIFDAVENDDEGLRAAVLDAGEIVQRRRRQRRDVRDDALMDGALCLRVQRLARDVPHAHAAP